MDQPLVSEGPIEGPAEVPHAGLLTAGTLSGEARSAEALSIAAPATADRLAAAATKTEACRTRPPGQTEASWPNARWPPRLHRGVRPGVTEGGESGPERVSGWERLLFPAVFLAVLAQTAAGVNRSSTGIAAVAGYAILGGFCFAYLSALKAVWGHNPRRFWAVYGGMVGLWVLEMPFAHGDASVMCIFIAVLAIGRLGLRATPIVAATTAVAVFVPALIPSWHDGIDLGAAASICMVSLAMYAFFALVHANHELTEARSEVARLAAENERNRIARDLHDLLGHSLTTITVKAGLARRLATTDPQRSAQEIAEVEELSRSSLADVRAVVSNYRDVTLTGELATARELLRAAGIEAQLPRAIDVVAPANQGLFAWVIREGLTNVVRHAHASVCTVTMGPASLDIVDDGVGSAAGAGNGLRGLQERVEAAGGTLDVGALPRGGWRMHVEVPSAAPG